VTTVSAVTGLSYCFAQLGSWDMSIVRGFAGVPSKLTRPLTIPFCGLADEMANVVKTAAIPKSAFLACMDLSLLIFSLVS
jgi:hypothetical protein